MIQSREEAAWLAAGERSREVRFGLVLYGGVSLAIYINGVAQEFFRAVHGRGVYKWLKALTDSDVVVDVVSGTSAGGINGILLAYALCNDRDFTFCSSLWRNDGDIRALLRSPRKRSEGYSLLDSEGYFQSRLEAAFSDMPPYTPETGEIPSRTAELDLFVTGTDIDGNVWTEFDDAGHPIDVKEHRAVFLLKHRERRKTPFEPHGGATKQTVHTALAKLARITSCFPAAFAPVLVTQSDDEDTPDALLQQWGALGKESAFLDGGVLDNKPFTHTLREIFSRTATREVDRRLIYVEPDPEHFEQSTTASTPDVVQAALAALIGIPGYESIASDLQMLSEHNSRVKRYNQIVSTLETAGTPPPQATERAVYVRSRMLSLCDRVIQGLFVERGQRALLDNARDRTIASALVEYALSPAGVDLAVTGAECQRGMEAEAVAKLKQTAPADRLATAEGWLDEFDVLYRLRRTYFLIYKIHRHLYREDVDVSDDEIDVYLRLRTHLNRHVKLLEIVRARIEHLVDVLRVDWRAPGSSAAAFEGPRSEDVIAVWGQILDAHRSLLDVDDAMKQTLERELTSDPREADDWLTTPTLTALNERLRERADTIAAHAAPDAAPAKSTLLEAVDALERRLVEHFLPPDDRLGVRAAFDGFESYDARLFPIEMVSGLYEKDSVQTVRISPRDAQIGFSRRPLKEKVSGDALYHFGGFFKRSWRSNDILWGRLDGACQLVEILLDANRLASRFGVPDETDVSHRADRRRARAVAAAREEFFDENGKFRVEMDPSTLFPKSGTATHKLLGDWLRDLLADTPADGSAHPLTEERRQQVLSLLIEATQLEILGEEVPSVIADALAEQSRWNQFRAPARLTDEEQEALRARNRDPSRAFYFEPVRRSLDPFVGVLAAVGKAQDLMQALTSDASRSPSPTQTKLGQFFTTYYRVGSERVTYDVPLLVLLEIVAVAMLGVRECLLRVLHDHRSKIESSPLYRFGVDYPLRTFHAGVQFLRRAPSQEVSVHVAIAIGCLVLLFVAYFLRQSLFLGPGIPSAAKSLNALLFVGLPLVVLFLQSTIIRHGRYGQWRRVQVAAAIIRSAVVVVVAAAALVLAARLAALVLSWLRDAAAWLATSIPGLGTTVPAGAGASFLEEIALGASFGLVVGTVLVAYYVVRRRSKRRVRAGELERQLRDHFTQEETVEIARRLGIDLAAADLTRRDRVIRQLVKSAKANGQLGRLYDAMYAINPSAVG
jgi:patatin-related protein